MFTREEIQDRLRGRPFRPLRIIASEGLRFDVLHPDLVWAGRRFLLIGHATAAAPTVFDQQSRVALVHVVALQDLPFAQPPTANGPA